MNTFNEDILIIGAGISGLSAAIHLKTECPGRRVTLLERRERIGGTWDLFRYPGIRSDSDMFSFGFKFKPWKNAHFFSQGGDIRDYLQEAAEENHVFNQIRFRRHVQQAAWDSDTQRWTVQVRDEAAGTDETYVARFVLFCAGYYNYDQGYRPEFKGEERFKGTFIHPQHWPEGFDYSGKHVTVIGSGATAVTLVPSMAPKASHVTMLQRSPSYIFSLPSTDPLTWGLQKFLSPAMAYALNRKRTIGMAEFMFRMCKQRPKAMRRVLLSLVRAQLRGSGIDMKHFTPNYLPWDQRLCLVPDGDFFKTLKSGKASIETDTIDTLTEDGIRLSSGKEIKTDVIVTATGLNVRMVGGIDIRVDGEKVDLSSRMFYKSVLLQNVPNAAVFLGYTHISWTLKSDLASAYICRLIKHMDRKGLGMVVPTAPADVQPIEELTVLGGLQSNYLKRVAHELPRQGGAHPWRNRQDYYHDSKVLLNEPIETPELRFEKRVAGATGKAKAEAEGQPASV